MQVKMGNPAPTTSNIADRTEPTVETMTVDPSYSYVPAYDDGETQTIGRGRDVDVTSAVDLANEVAAHIGRSVDGITHVPGQEALLSVVAAWRAQSYGNPTWVWSDDEDFATLLGAFFDAPVGEPGDVEATHHTDAGPPGVGVAEPATEETP